MSHRSEEIDEIDENFDLLISNYAFSECHKEVQQDYIDWEQPDLSLEQLFLRFLEYKMVLCPVGNGIDTHRLWEVLYCNRIPVTIKVGDFKIYSLYEELPIVILDSYSELLNQERIEEKYQQAVNKKYDTQILETTYWENKIRNTKL